MDDESGESTEEDDVTGVGRGESETERDWDEVDGEEQGFDSTDKVRHIERNDQLCVTRMRLVVE